jgi:hypothetical protein
LPLIHSVASELDAIALFSIHEQVNEILDGSTEKAKQKKTKKNQHDNKPSTAKSFEYTVLNNTIVINFHLQFHYIATSRSSHYIYRRATSMQEENRQNLVSTTLKSNNNLIKYKISTI